MPILTNCNDNVSDKPKNTDNEYTKMKKIFVRSCESLRTIWAKSEFVWASVVNFWHH